MTPAQMAALHAQCFDTPRPWSAAEFAALLSSPTTFTLTRPTGFLLGRAVADEAELLTLAVDPNHRRAGHGRALVAAFLDESRQKHAATAFLEVAADNAPAIALYHSAGFTESGRRPRYYAAADGTRRDALILLAQLA